MNDVSFQTRLVFNHYHTGKLSFFFVIKDNIQWRGQTRAVFSVISEKSLENIVNQLISLHICFQVLKNFQKGILMVQQFFFANQVKHILL